MSQRVIVEHRGPVSHVRLNRADKHNALDLDMFRALAQAQRSIRRRQGVRVVILSGAGENFSTGLDIKSMMGQRSALLKLLWKWLPGQANLAQRVSIGWRRLPVPVIACLHGRCWGGGLQIALGADFRIAHPDTSLSVMEAKWGLIPDMGGTVALRDLLARDQAMRLAMTAEIFDATRALQLGLLTEIADPPAAAASALSEQLLERSPDALAAIKRLYRKSWGGERATLARETAYQWRVILGANQRIAVRRQRGETIEYKNGG